MKSELLKKEARKSKSIQDDLKEDQGRGAAQLEDNRPETFAESKLLNDSDAKSAEGKAEPVAEVLKKVAPEKSQGETDDTKSLEGKGEQVAEVLKKVIEEKSQGETDDAKSPEGKMSTDSVTMLDEEKGNQK